ncbi:MAG: glycosyltransferase family 4 protein [Lachnospiraceae bacterium]|nr:glycosyltransferase family 4 protein [Lachnospiraceae bacterium]
MARILFVRSTPYDEDLNGYNVQGAGIAKACVRLGHDCDYLNFHKTREETVDLCEENGHKARVIFTKRIRLFRTGLNFDVLKDAFLSRYDIVICREYNQLMTHLIAKRHPNTSMYSGPYYNMFMVPFFSGIYDALFTKKLDRELKGKFVKSELAKEYLEQKGYTDLVDLGVGLDTTRFEHVECTESTAKLADYMRENRCILYVGTLSERKNIPLVLGCFRRVLERHPDVKLVLVGKSEQTLKNKLLGKKNESYFEDLMRDVPENVRASILHVERVDNPQLKFIYPLAKAFVLPSLLEIFGMVLLEALYFGAPTVTSWHGGSSTLMRDERYGQVIRAFDPDRWADAVCRYLENPGYAAEVSENGKRLIAESFTWDTIMKKMLDCIANGGRETA